MKNGRKQTGRRQKRAIVLVAAFALFASLVNAPASLAYADESSTNNAEYEQALANLNSITDEYVGLAQELDDTLTQLQQTRDEIAANKTEMDGVREEIKTCQTELKAQQATLAQHVSDSYKSGGVNLLSILLSSTSWEDAVSRIYYLQAINKAEVGEIAAVNEAKSALQDQQKELEDLQTQLKDQEATLAALYEDQNSQSEQMHQQQLEAAELLQSIPQETKEQLEAEDKEIIESAEQVVASETTEETEKDEKESQSSESESESKKEEEKQEQSSNESNESQDTQKEEETQTTQPTINGNGTLQAVLDAAYSSWPSDEAGRRGWGCSGYIYFLFQMAGINAPTNNGSGYTNAYCYSSNRSELKPGMIIGVTTHTRSSAGSMNGHVGLYVGNNTVRDFGSSGINEWPLDSWIDFYGTTVAVRWGWYGGVVLS